MELEFLNLEKRACTCYKIANRLKVSCCVPTAVIATATVIRFGQDSRSFEFRCLRVQASYPCAGIPCRPY